MGPQGADDYHSLRSAARAERWARENLGIATVDYGGNIAVANVFNKALLSLLRHRVPMPARVTAEPSEFVGRPNELAAYEPPLSGVGPGRILVNDHPAWSDGGKMLKAAGRDRRLSTGDRHHPVMHEMGELVLHQLICEHFDEWTQGYRVDEEAFQRLLRGTLRDLRRLVSVRATLNHGEFVAELFAALMLGRMKLRENAMLMNAYERFGTRAIRRYDR